jgi:dTDP-4-amino-4,6-dideoxygalactose transaminase
MDIPFYSCKESFRRLWPRLAARLERAIDAGAFTDGPFTLRLEEALKAYTGARHAVGVSNGTDALILMLQAAGIGPGDEVIVPCFTFVASATSVAHVGARPVFVDIDPRTYNLDVEALEALVTPRTRAIMPVHLFAQMADMPAVLRVADRHGLQVLEDSAEGIGMRCDGGHAGTWGRAGTLSFFPTKTLGAIGDAGLILTDDDDLADTFRMLRDHGRAPGRLEARFLGHNAKMDEVQAAVLLTRLECLADDVRHRAELAAYYDRRLQALAPRVTTPRLVARPYATDPVFYVYLIETERRDELVAHLGAHGIGTEVYYPIPIHLQPAFAGLGHRPGDFPHAERACRRTVALPLYPDLSVAQAEVVCRTIESFYGVR